LINCVRGEDKWNLLSAWCCCCSRYEGRAEHSSARIERFLQLAARDNIQICQPRMPRSISTAAAQRCANGEAAHRLHPKSMLRHPDALSPLED